MRLFPVLTLCILATSTFALAADLGKVPVRPGSLLKYLPPADQNWLLTQSNGAHVRRNPPLSKAKRVFTSAAVPATGAPAPTVTVTVVDACVEMDVLNEYVESPETQAPDNPGRLFKVAGMPAKVIRNPGRPDSISILALQRFILSFELPAGQKVEEWLTKIDLKGLEAAGKETATIDLKASHVFTFETVDELEAKRNRQVKGEVGGEAPVQ